MCKAQSDCCCLQRPSVLSGCVFIPSVALLQLSVHNMSDGVRGEIVQNLPVSSHPLSRLTDETTHTPSRTLLCWEVIHCSWSDKWLHPVVPHPVSTVQSSRTTAGQQENSSWHLYHPHRGRNWIIEAAQRNEAFIPAVTHAGNVCIEEHLTGLQYLTSGTNSTQPDAFFELLWVFRGRCCPSEMVLVSPGGAERMKTDDRSNCAESWWTNCSS